VHQLTGVSWANVSTNVFMWILGAVTMFEVRVWFSLTGDQAAWASALATLVTGAGAVLGAFWLWRQQQMDRTRQLKKIGLAIFVDVYNRLLELEVFTCYEKWLVFHEKVHGSTAIGTETDARLRHKKAAQRYMHALSAESTLAIENFSVLRDNLGDVDDERRLVMLRLYTFLGGIPSQLKRFLEEWDVVDVVDAPAALSEDSKKLLGYAIGACAFLLNKLDGVERSKSKAEMYGKFYAAQRAIHDPQSGEEGGVPAR
jgi:hypothetical protein